MIFKNRLIRFGLFLIILNSILFSGRVQACACGTTVFGETGIAGPIITIPAHTLKKGKVVFGTNLQYINLVGFSQARIRSLNRRRMSAHTFDNRSNIGANLAYGLTDDLSLFINLPFRMTNNITTTFQGISVDEGDSIGFGDLTLLSKYRFLNLEKKKISVAALAGIKMPTGDTSETNEFGLRLANDDQPGSGSWDPIMGLAASKLFKNWSLDANVLYTLTTPGLNDAIVGDLINFNLATAYSVRRLNKNFIERLFPNKLFGQSLAWNLILEMNGAWREKAEIDGIKDPSHGGTTILINPGIRVAVNDKLIANFSVGLPIFENLNGDQPATSFQLFGGLSWVF